MSPLIALSSSSGGRPARDLRSLCLACFTQRGAIKMWRHKNLAEGLCRPPPRSPGTRRLRVTAVPHCSRRLLVSLSLPSGYVAVGLPFA